MLNQFGKDRFAFIALGIQRQTALVAVQHRKIQAVNIWNILKLASCRISNPGSLHLDDIRSKPGQQLCAGRT